MCGRRESNTLLQWAIAIAVGTMPLLFVGGILAWHALDVIAHRSIDAAMAAWVQAISSVFAILAAVAIPSLIAWMQRRDALGRERAIARSTALHLLPHFNMQLNQLEAACRYDALRFEKRTPLRLGDRSEVAILTSTTSRVPELQGFASLISDTALVHEVRANLHLLPSLGEASVIAQEAVRRLHDVSAMYQIAENPPLVRNVHVMSLYSEARGAALRALEALSAAVDAMHRLFPDAGPAVDNCSRGDAL